MMSIYMIAEKSVQIAQKLGWHSQILIDPAKLILGYGNRYLFFNVFLYSITVIITLIQIHGYHC